MKPDRRRRGARVALIGAIVLALAAAGCSAAPGGGSTGSTAAPGTQGNRVLVVTTNTVFADLVAQVGGERVESVSLVPNGGDVHTYDPRPSDAARLSKARLIVMNGLGLDDWLTNLVSTAGAAALVVRLGEGLPDVRYLSGENGATNPHLWLNVANAERYVARLADALARVDAAGAPGYRTRAAAYTRRLQDLDAWVRAQIETIPVDQRRLVSFHDAFPYFADAYGLQIVGSVVAAPGQDPGAADVAHLVDAIRAAHVRAVFAEPQFNPAVVQAVAREAGVRVVTDLYDDTLGPPPVDTYEGMIRWDVERVVGALR